jgi:hypothetical protein
VSDDVVSGEGGEVPMPASSGDSSASAPAYESEYEPESSSDAGSTSGAGTLQLEVQILAADAVDRVADEIARRVAAKVEGTRIRSITVASPTIIAYLRLHSAIEAELVALEAMTDRVAAAAAASTSGEAGFAEVAAVEAAKAARSVVTSVSSALRNFAATTKYSGRTNVARQTVLDAALAKHLSGRKLDVEVPEHALPAIEPRGLIARMLQLQERCREIQAGGGNVDGLTPIVNSVESLLNLVFGTSDGGSASAGVPIAQQLMLADGVARGMIKGKAVLFAEIAFSGGSYRTRKWIFNFLVGSDGLTYSGGAGVTYFLFRGDDRVTLDSDTLYFASPHGRFHHETSQRFSPTNINP